MGLVQSAQGSTTGTTLTVTLPAGVTAQHGVIVALAGYSGGTVTSITLTAARATFTRVASAGTITPNCETWACMFAAQSGPPIGSTVVITTTAPGIIAYVYEIESAQQAAGMSWQAEGINVTLDQTAGNAGGSGTSWSSGATAATVHGPEFVVGIGLIMDNAGLITGPASPWVNLPAITDVTAAGHTFGAVSGYQVTSATPATYDYAGTSGTGGGWAAVTATFLLMPQGQFGWSGYIWDQNSAPAGGFTGVSATFTIPSLPSGEATPGGSVPACSIWVGLGDAVPQCGVYCTYDTSAPGNNSLFLWSFYEPGGITWDSSAFPAAPGDSLTASISTDGTYVYEEMANSTQGWSYTEQKSFQALSLNSVNVASPKPWAEIIVEDEGGQTGLLPNYGTLTFTGVTITPTPLGPPVPWAFCRGADITQVPGPYSGGSFTMYYEAES